MGFLGEYSADSSPIFFLIAFALMGVSFLMGEKIYVPFKSSISLLIIVFSGVLFLSTLINIDHVLDYYFKHTSGLNRFIRQLASFIISAYIFLLLFCNVTNNIGTREAFLKIRKTMFLSLIIVFTAGAIEFSVIVLHINALTPILHLFDYLPFVEMNPDYNLQRVKSICFESPILAIYLITIIGFMFSYIFTSKYKVIKFIPFIAVLFLAIVSKSRTALVVIFIQILLGFIFSYLNYYKFRIFTKRLLIGGTILSIIALIFFHNAIFTKIESRLNSLDFSKLKYNPENNSISNKTRIGMQVAMFEVFKDHPLLGVGWGQQAFESRFEYPNWATKDNYEFDFYYENVDISSFPPGFNMYMRILAELGIIGLLIFGIFLLSIYIELYNIYINPKVAAYLSIALLISISGFIINWLQIDTFRMYGFWFSIALIIILRKEEKLCLKE